jgi:phenylalanine-4-hydroxylase
MSNIAHTHALMLRLDALTRRTSVLRQRLGRLDGIAKLRCQSEIKKLEAIARMLRRHSQLLTKQNQSFWQAINVNALIVGDEFEVALKDFFDRLDNENFR